MSNSSARDFAVLYEEGPVFVVNKPAGLATQAPAQFDSLEARVRKWLRDCEGDSSIYLGVPHRLDRPVSGCIVFATTRRAAFKLSRQFERRTVSKRYWACVEGFVEPAEGLWVDFMWKVYGQPQAKVVEPTHPGAQQAVLRYRTLGKHLEGTWLEIELVTGRTHQIRVQAASRGHAAVGDAMYGASTPFGPSIEDERQRPIALHAHQLSFQHPVSNEPIEVTAPLAGAWESLHCVANDKSTCGSDTRRED